MSKKFLDNNGLLYVWNKIVAKFQAKELKTGSTTDYKVLSDNNLTNELVEKINNAGTSNFSGNYADLVGAPEIPANTSDLTNDSGFITKDVNDLANYTKTTDLKAVATSGKYEDLEGTPDLAVYAKDADLHAVAKSGAYTDLEGTPDLTVFAKSADLKAVATTGSYNDLTDKPVIPTNNNELTNGAGYQTAAQVQEIVNGAVGQITGISYEVVTELPTAGEAGVIYLMANGGANPNVYDEYIFANGKFEKIGTTETDLTGYLHEDDVITNAEIDALLA